MRSCRPGGVGARSTTWPMRDERISADSAGPPSREGGGATWKGQCRRRRRAVSASPQPPGRPPRDYRPRRPTVRIPAAAGPSPSQLGISRPEPWRRATRPTPRSREGGAFPPHSKSTRREARPSTSPSAGGGQDHHRRKDDAPRCRCCRGTRHRRNRKARIRRRARRKTSTGSTIRRSTCRVFGLNPMSNF